MNRCIAYNKNNKKCRAKLMSGQFFCCESHYPINREIIDEGCFICMEKITSIEDMYYFRCKHVMHKKCYDEWLNYSNYGNNICMLCRGEVFKKPPKKTKTRKLGVINKNDYKKLENIINIINT